MNTVYVVQQSVPYEVDQLMGVFQTKESAANFITELTKGTDYKQINECVWEDPWGYLYYYEEMEVQ